MAKTIFEELGGRYERQGDYLIPCLTLAAGADIDRQAQERFERLIEGIKQGHRVSRNG